MHPKGKTETCILPGDGREGASLWRATVLCVIQTGEDGKGKEGHSRKQDCETEIKATLT